MRTHNATDETTAAANGTVRSILDFLSDSVYVKDLEGRIVTSNAAHARFFGLASPEQVTGKTDFDLFPKELAERNSAEDNALLQSGQALNREESVTDPATGEIRWQQTTKTPLRDGSGTITGLIGIVRDITKQKQAEESLRRPQSEPKPATIEPVSAGDASVQAQRLLQALMDNIPDWIYFKDTQSRFLKCSRTHANRLRIEPDQVVGKTDFDFHPRDQAEEFFRDEQKIIQTGEPLINKVEQKSKPNGDVLWTSTTKVPMRDENGAVIGIVGVNRDITDRMRAEEALRQTRDELERHISERTAELSRERLLLRTLIDNLPDAIYAKDMDCRKILVNRADLKNLRCSTEADAIGKSDFDLFSKDIAEKFYADDQKVIQGEPVLNREEYFFDEERRQHWLLTSKLPLRDPDGKIVGLMGIGRDITAVKEAERKLAAVNSQLVEASRQAGMAEVATGVLHNVGNVLNSVNVSAEMISQHLKNSRSVGVAKLAKLLREHETDLATFFSQDERGRNVATYLEALAVRLDTERDELSEEVKKLIENVGHIKEIVNAQQNYAGISGVVEAITLPELVEDALKIHNRAFARHGVTVIKEFEALPPVSTDRHKVLQIMVNLLHNAKYACDDSENPRKEVAIRVKAAESNRVRIEVADTGVGISPENLTRIFSHGFTTRKNGHGFGLHSGALSARQLGGSLTAHSAGPGQGALFVLELPIASGSSSHEQVSI